MKIHVLTENDAPYETGTFSWLSATLIEELSSFGFVRSTVHVYIDVRQNPFKTLT